MADYSFRLSPERITVRARSQSNICSPGRRFTAAVPFFEVWLDQEAGNNRTEKYNDVKPVASVRKPWWK
jgi:hypothetical protein